MTFEEWKEREGFSDIMEGYTHSFRACWETALEQGRREGMEEAIRLISDIPTTVSVHLTSHDASIATSLKETIIMALSAAIPAAEVKE